MQKSILALVLVAAAGLQGCAAIVSGASNLGNNEETVNQKATDYFQAKPGEVKVTNIQKQALATDFRAQYKGKPYNCTVYYGNVKCEAVPR
ncbi:hypothetical protein [Alicycliphilus denitrificans]|uniref:hypothetical protein n=1 Tax=Alicycliphilus denitrificans TaxID=179636 RepID=UPI00384F2307